MAALIDAKTIAHPFGNERSMVRITWDYSRDGGAAGDFDVLIADGAILVKCIGAIVKSAVTSGGLLDLDLGKGAGGVEFLSSVAVASLTLNSFQVSATSAFIKLADGEKIVMGIDTAAATAGKIEFIFEVVKF